MFTTRNPGQTLALGQSAPLVSVIVPSYNHVRYVRDCLDSIVADPYPAKELIVIDDGSSDGSADTIAAWAAENSHGSTTIRFSQRPNRGQTATLNELVKLAQGTYVAYLASDDTLVPGGLDARVEYLESHPDKKAVFGDCEVIDAHGDRLMASGLSDLHGVRKHRLQAALSAEIVGNWGVPGPVLMYRQEAIEAIGGYEEGDVIEDWNVYLGFVARDWLGFIDVVVGRYRLHGENTMLRPELQTRIYSNLLRAAQSRLSELAFPDQYRLVQQICSINAMLARLNGYPGRWVGWRVAAGTLKLPVILVDWISDSHRLPRGS